MRLPTSTETRRCVWQEQNRPYIILKWAQTADGFIAPDHNQPYWISNAAARRLVHQWRADEAAIWVGKNTYVQDNPHLNVREVTGPDPVRIAVDPSLALPQSLHLFDGSQPTLYYNNLKARDAHNLSFIKFPRGTSDWKVRTQFVLNDLYQRNLKSLFVEGGSVLLSFLIESGWWDEARVFSAPTRFDRGVAAPAIGDRHQRFTHDVEGNLLTVYHWGE